MSDNTLKQRAEQASDRLESIRELWRPLAKRIHHIEVEYDGYGDEGNIDEVRFFDRHNREVRINSAEAQELDDAITDFCSDVLPGGWEIDDGAFGTISLNWSTGEIFGVTLTNREGRVVPVRWVGEQHVKEDLGRIPTPADWLRGIPPEPWMQQAERLSEAEFNTAPASQVASSTS